jgi:cation diffusion facilitator CzcD-associated flavoprotein CzcO
MSDNHHPQMPQQGTVPEHSHQSGVAPALECDVIIVGSGFSGIAMGVELRRAGVESFVILERADAPGGTWRDNHYPGAACDVPSHLYSYSFEQADWSRFFAPQPEIRDYLRHCLDKYGLAEKVRYRRQVTAAWFDAGRRRWRVTTGSGEAWMARALVLGNGPLSNPARPEIPGLENFAGRIFHSARWEQDWVAADRRIAVIGTGASAIQIVPELAASAAKLHVFQRTPPWILPRHDAALGPNLRSLLAGYPDLHRLYRASIYWRYESRALGFTVHKSLLAPGRWMALRHLRRQVRDPALRRRLTPDYAIGCKRVLLSDDYYPALQRGNVELVTTPIERVTEDGIRVGDGIEYRVDTIVLATGFAATEYLSTIEVRNQEGRRLDEGDSGMPSVYLGITARGFPNLFLLMGPNTGLGHNSMVFMIEAQARYARQGIEKLVARDGVAMDVRAEVQRRYEAGLQERLDRSVWNSGCRSWYLKDGRNPVIWPGFTFEYWLKTRRLNPEDYHWTPGAAQAAAKT